MREGFSGGLVGDVVPIMSMNLAWPGREGVVTCFPFLGMGRGREKLTWTRIRGLPFENLYSFVTSDV